MDLTADLQRVDGELLSAKVEVTRLNARIDGLQAERDALAAAMLGAPGSPASTGSALERPTKARAILNVLAASPAPLRIGQIIEALRAEGWPSENYNGISVYLNDMVNRVHSVDRVDRGLYTVADG